MKIEFTYILKCVICELAMLIIYCRHTPTVGKLINSEEAKLCTVIIKLLTKQVNILET